MRDQERSLTIKLEDFPSNPVFIGDKSRLSSATSVSFLAEDMIACAHFSGQKIYVYKFDLENGSYEKVTSANTTYRGQNCKTDLMTYDGRGRIAVTNFLQKTCTIYSFDGKDIAVLNYCPYDAGDVVHGVKFYNEDILAITSRRGGSGIHFFRKDCEDPIYIVKSDRKSVQDFCFISESRLAVISTTNSPRPHPQEMWSSHIDIVDFDLDNRSSTIAYSMEIEKSHLDNIVMRDSNLYMSDQYNNAVLVFDKMISVR